MEINFLLQSLLSGELRTRGLRWLSWAGGVVISGILGPRKSLCCVVSPEHTQQHPGRSGAAGCQPDPPRIAFEPSKKLPFGTPAAVRS